MDENLYLNRAEVIVLVSLGAARLIELRNRQPPHDTAQVTLPSSSLFMLGPANARFTHAVLPASGEGDGAPDVGEEGGRATCRVEDGGRISLAFCAVHTCLDRDTGCLFGQAVAASCCAPLLAGEGAVTEVVLSLAVASVRE